MNLALIIGLIVLGALLALNLRNSVRKARLANAHYKEIIDQTNDGVIICDAATQRLLYSNPAIQQRLGYEPQELLAMHIDELFAADANSLSRRVRF